MYVKMIRVFVFIRVILLLIAYIADKRKGRTTDMTFAKICLAVLVCIPLISMVYFFVKKLVDQIK